MNGNCIKVRIKDQSIRAVIIVRNIQVIASLSCDPSDVVDFGRSRDEAPMRWTSAWQINAPFPSRDGSRIMQLGLIQHIPVDGHHERNCRRAVVGSPYFHYSSLI